MKRIIRALKAGYKGFFAGFHSGTGSTAESLVHLEALNKQYSGERQAFVAMQYQIASQAYRQKVRRLVTALLIISVSGILIIPHSFYVGVTMFISGLLIGLLCISIQNAPPPCSGCGKQVDFRYGPYCPRCGGILSPGEIASERFCPNCAGALYFERGSRNYLIHNCTHCGVFLDKRGV